MHDSFRLPSIRTIALITLGFFALGLLIYGWSLDNPFVRWDDGMLIYENPAIRSISFSSLKWIFTHFDPELYIPLTFFSYQIDYLLGGINPFLFHLNNLLLHTFSALLVALLCLRFFERKWVALFCGLLFLVHPINTEAVEWASGRKDVLSTFFFLASLVAYFFYRDKGNRKWYIISVLAFLCGLLSKVMVLTLPVILLLLDYAEHRKFSWKMLLEKIPYFALSIIFGLVGLLGKEGVVASSTLLEKILMAFKSTAFYIQQFFWPAKFSLLYPYTKAITFTSPDFFVPMILVAAVLIAAVLLRNRARLITCGVLFYFITVAPTLINFSKGDLDIYFASDRYAYIPQIGLIVILAYAISRVCEWYSNQSSEPVASKTIAGICAIVLCILAMLSYRQSLVWASTATLFQHVIEVYPDASYVAYNNLGNAERLNGNINTAIEQYAKALAVRPNARTYSNLGAAYRKQKNYVQAADAYDKALAIDPQSPYAHFGLGIVLAEQGKFDLAELEYLKAIGLKDNYTDVYVNLGALYAAQGKYEQAVERYNKALTFSGFYPTIFYNLAVAETALGKTDDAIAHYQRAIELDPSMIAPRINVALLLYNNGDTDAAIVQFRAVLAIDPQNRAALSALQQLGQGN